MGTKVPLGQLYIAVPWPIRHSFQVLSPTLRSYVSSIQR